MRLICVTALCLAAETTASASDASRFYISAAAISASAFDLVSAGGTTSGKYLYSYLEPSPEGPTLRTSTYRVKIIEKTIEISDRFGHRCHDWHLLDITAKRLRVNFGTEAVTYIAYPRSAYQDEIKALGSIAAALHNHGGGLIDSFKPRCETEGE
jgi:hypothetical protein